MIWVPCGIFHLPAQKAWWPVGWHEGPNCWLEEKLTSIPWQERWEKIDCPVGVANSGRKWANTSLSLDRRGSVGLGFCTPNRTVLQASLTGRTSAKGNSVPEKEAGHWGSCFYPLAARRTALSSRKCSPCTPSPPPVAWKRCHPLSCFMQTLCGQKNVPGSLWRKVSLQLPWRQELVVRAVVPLWGHSVGCLFLKALRKFLSFLWSGVKAFSFCVLWPTTGCFLDFVCALCHSILILFHMTLFLSNLLRWDLVAGEMRHNSSPPGTTLFHKQL